jgi:subtilisin family serine protease
MVAAAGNVNTSTIGYPAGYEGVIGVTSVASDNRKSDFANYGSWVDLAAPGEGITSTIVGPQGSGYGVWRGTSMATAFVSGAAALARQKFHKDISSTLEISQLLTVNARNIDDPINHPEYVGQLGGLLDIGAALVDQSPTATATPTSTPIASETPMPTPSETPAATPTVTPTPTEGAPVGPGGRVLLPMLFD